ncbi:MAG TPA: DUF58 domain-containing protein [Bacteroidales bacterium]|jgi:uncharacterized protein (DUF58 family)|nr:DUF58 domain-containing protein [Bacteroidales bacterium]HOL98085.1 DUF58 domain-containing protein [Bacteroidales bacterium]HOM37450.1 DUF58 domain-containing protein [Bacteroidales bacterium]HPD23671.1 DUF58 domain-containing protein [Bacteroidales bacterium]HRS99692.1 DUF58 domain-containing protein [Bacteroidales bacterium]
MEASELLKKVRKIEIKSKGLTRQIFAGEYHSAFKGKGMTFSEVREYQYGDPIKDIDWHVTARFNHPYVKVFEEERELTVMLLIDVSASKSFGTVNNFKKDIITEIAAVLSFSAITNNDKIGVILFSDKIEKFIPPKKGRKHILRIILELLNFEPENKGSDLKVALKFFTNAIKKRSTAFIMSDFIVPDFTDALKIASNKHDIVALRIYDKFEKELPDIGLAYFNDLESGKMKWIDTGKKAIREQYRNWWNNHYQNTKTIFKKLKIDNTDISTSDDYVRPLIALFKNR